MSSEAEKADDDISPVVKFFHGEKDPLGRTYDEMLDYSLDRMEECHDYVQWMWPLHEPSMFAVVYPVLTPAQASLLRNSPDARSRMKKALQRFRLFYGLPHEVEVGTGSVPAEGLAASTIFPLPT